MQENSGFTVIYENFEFAKHMYETLGRCGSERL
jgi:hypothetical protein